MRLRHLFDALVNMALVAKNLTLSKFSFAPLNRPRPNFVTDLFRRVDVV